MKSSGSDLALNQRYLISRDVPKLYDAPIFEFLHSSYCTEDSYGKGPCQSAWHLYLQHPTQEGFATLQAQMSLQTVFLVIQIQGQWQGLLQLSQGTRLSEIQEGPGLALYSSFPSK